MSNTTHQGSHTFQGAVTMTVGTGNVTLTSGNLIVSAGDLTVTAGAVALPLTNYADDTAAAAGGVAVGELYHTAGTVKIRLV